MTTEEKLKHAQWNLTYHEKEADKHLVEAQAYRLLKEECERTLVTEEILHETESAVRQSLHAVEGMRQ